MCLHVHADDESLVVIKHLHNTRPCTVSPLIFIFARYYNIIGDNYYNNVVLEITGDARGWSMELLMYRGTVY